MSPDPSSGTATIKRQSLDPDTMSMPLRFLDLPAEIRLQILEFTLTDGTRASTIKLFTGRVRTIRSSDDSAEPNTQLLLAGRQINAEGTPILYSKNTFSLSLTHLDYFTRIVGSVDMQYVGHLHIRLSRLNLIWGPERFGSLKKCIGLKRLRLDIAQLFIPELFFTNNSQIFARFYAKSFLRSLTPLVKMLCEREASEEAARKVIEVLPPEKCSGHDSYVWIAIPCIQCCDSAREYEGYKVIENEFWNDIPERFRNAELWVKEEERQMEQRRKQKWRAT